MLHGIGVGCSGVFISWVFSADCDNGDEHAVQREETRCRSLPPLNSKPKKQAVEHKLHAEEDASVAIDHARGKAKW